MKKLLLTLALVAGFATAANASPIVGTESFSGAGSTAKLSGVTRHVNRADTITTHLTTSATGGDFAGSPVVTSELASFTGLTPNALTGSFTFSVAGWGTFTSSSQTIDSATPLPPSNTLPATRVLQFAGTFTPSFGGFDPNTNATFTILFSQPVNGDGGITVTLAQLDAPAAVPEPATLVMLGTLLVPAGIVAVRRRRALAK